MSTNDTTTSKVTVRRNGVVVVDGLTIGKVEKVGRDSWQALDNDGKALGCAWGHRSSAVQQLIGSEYAKTYAASKEAAQPAAAEAPLTDTERMLLAPADEAIAVADEKLADLNQALRYAQQDKDEALIKVIRGDIEAVQRLRTSLLPAVEDDAEDIDEEDERTEEDDVAVHFDSRVVGYAHRDARGLWSAWAAPTLCVAEDFPTLPLAAGVLIERELREQLLKTPDPLYGNLNPGQLDYRKRVYDRLVEQGEGIVRRTFGTGNLADLTEKMTNLDKLKGHQRRIDAELARREAAREAEQARQDWLIERNDH